MGNMKSSLKATNSTSTVSSNTKSEAATMYISRTIDKQIKIDQKRMKKEVKLLLLGEY